ncbi:MAG: hypothetical protein U0Q21_09970 [Dermatophilaceae bacterium]
MTAHVPASRRLNGPYAVLPLFLSALLLVAFVVAPPLLMPVARGGDLAMRAHELVTAWVARGGAGPPAALREFLDGWRDYHLLKAALAAAAAVALWRVARAAGRRSVGRRAVGRRAVGRLAVGRLAVGRLAVWRRAVVGGRAYGPVGVSVTAAGLAVLAVLAVLANLQGALAPLASAVSLLPPADGDMQYAAALARLSAGVSGGPAHATGPAGAVLTDFAFFHLVLAGLVWLLAVGLGTVSFQLARRRVRAGREGGGTARETRFLTRLSALSAAAAIVALVVAGANLSTAGDAGPELAAYLTRK